MKLNKLIYNWFHGAIKNFKILLLLPIAPIHKSLLQGGRSQSHKQKIISYLLLVIIGMMCSIVFRFNLFQFLGINSMFISPIIVFACIFLFFVITMIIKRIVFFNTYYLQVKEGVRHNKITYNVKLLFIFKVLVFTFLSILYTYNFIFILRNTNYLTEDFLCILFLALIFYLQFYYVTFNKENYDTYINFEASITRRLFIILMISIISYISLIMFINFELYKLIILNKHVYLGPSGGSALKGKELYMYPHTNTNNGGGGANNGEGQGSKNVIENENQITDKGDSKNNSSSNNTTKINIIKNRNIINDLEDKSYTGKGKAKANTDSGSTHYYK